MLKYWVTFTILLTAFAGRASHAQILTHWYEAPEVGGIMTVKPSRDYPDHVRVETGDYRFIYTDGKPKPTRVFEYRDWHFAPNQARKEGYEIKEVKLVCVKAGNEGCDLTQFVGVDTNGVRILLTPAIFAYGDKKQLRRLKKAIQGDFWYEPFGATQSLGSVCVGLPIIFIPIAVVVDIALIPAGIVSYPVHKIVEVIRRHKLNRLFKEGKVVRLKYTHAFQFIHGLERLK